MTFIDRQINLLESKYQLCFSCKNAYGNCSWSKSFIPVNGWTAKKRKLSLAAGFDESYSITACPEFEYDGLCSKCSKCPEHERDNGLFLDYCPDKKIVNGTCAEHSNIYLEKLK